MQYFVYVMTNDNNKVMYIGVTGNLKRRWYEHCSDMVDGFTKRYHVHKLVYYESYGDIRVAINREKQLKGWSRKKKNNLIETTNPDWKDLAFEWDWAWT